jgi:hypothetical protein
MQFLAFRHPLDGFIKKCSGFRSMLILNLEINDIPPNSQTIWEKECCPFNNGKGFGVSSYFLLDAKSQPPDINTSTFLEVSLAQSPSL